jgi:hypothetical protein
MISDLLPSLASLFSARFALSGLNLVTCVQLQHHPLVSRPAKELTYVDQDSRSEEPVVNRPGRKAEIRIEE